VGSELTLTVVHLDGVRTVRCEGEIDLATRDQLRDFLADQAGTVELDFGELAFLESVGVGVLVATANRLRADGGSLRIRRPQAHVRTVLEVVGLGDWLVDT
jgi:anti-sigma B factor antagonist